MEAATLPKATQRGFTVLSNRLIDQLLASPGKHTCDSLALALYLVRHVPAQSGIIELTSAFSQPTICEDLGWGKTNRARLKRALAQLVEVNVVRAELRDNNTVVLHVQAELDSSPPRVLSGAKAPGGGCKESSQGGGGAAKNPAPPPRQESSQASRASVISLVPKSSGLSSAERNSPPEIHHHRSKVTRDNPARAHEAGHDDDVDKLLRLYRSALKKAISPAIALNFAETYWANDRPYDLVEKGFRELASNPVLHARTTSPNAVWELDYMRKKAAEADARIRGAIESLRYRDDSDDACRQHVAELVKTLNLDPDVFSTYYASAIEALFAKRSEDRAAKVAWEAENSAQEGEDIPSGSSDVVASGEPSTPTEPMLEELESEVSGNAAAGLLAPSDSSTSATTCGEPPPTSIDAPVEQITPSSRVADAPAVTKLSSRCPQPPPPPELETARCKSDLVHLIRQALERETCATTRERLATLANFAAVDTMSFDALRALMRIHFRPSRRAA